MKRLLLISGHIDGKPTGGVTMHVHRLLKQVIEKEIPNYSVSDYKVEGFGAQIKKLREADVVHIHASNPFLKLTYAILGKLYGVKTLMTLHGRFGVYGRVKNFVNKCALRLCDVPILINKESFEEVSRFNSHSVFIPAFLPPIEAEEKLEEETARVISEIKSDGHLLFVTNASNRAYTDDGKEIYGITFLIDYFENRQDFNLLILDPKNQYWMEYKDKLPQNVTIITGLHSFCGAMELSDFVVRNTPIDGDSFSVKEALCYHKRIVATDAVSRPKGVFLFRYNDEASLDKAIGEAMAFHGAVNLEEEDAVGLYVQLYRSLGLC